MIIRTIWKLFCLIFVKTFVRHTLLLRKGVVCPSFRDNFSAGGRAVIHGISVPKIIGNISEWENEIAELFCKKASPLDSFYFWKDRLSSIKKFKAKEKNVLLEVLQKIESLICNHRWNCLFFACLCKKHAWKRMSFSPKKAEKIWFCNRKNL